MDLLKTKINSVVELFERKSTEMEKSIYLEEKQG